MHKEILNWNLEFHSFYVLINVRGVQNLRVTLGGGSTPESETRGGVAKHNIGPRLKLNQEPLVQGLSALTAPPYC